MIDYSYAICREFLQGIKRYIHTQEEWEIYLCPPYHIANKKPFRAWMQKNNIDGIIFQDSVNLQDLLNIDIPKIIFGTESKDFAGKITITADHYNISKMAAEYFIGLGFKNFAYFGYENFSWSIARLEAYQNIITTNKNLQFFEHMCSYSIYDSITKKHHISEWLKTLPKPLCIFACNDEKAVSVLEVCKIAGLKVPEEIAVLGIDDDELFCQLSYPPLSSIKVDFEKAGYEAAEVLNQQMHGEKSVSNITIKPKPQKLIQRQSTDIIAVEDDDVIKALTFIRKNCQKPIQVKDVVNVTACSRRILELRFKNYLKKSINDEINRLRIEHIKTKLLSSHDPIYKIAESLSFTDAEHFSRFFKNLTSISPTEYRQHYGKL